MTDEALKARIKARKILGMSAAEYDASLAKQRKLAIAEAIRAGIQGNAAEIDAAIANCKLLGCA